VNGVVWQVSYGTPVGNDAQFYKDIPVSPMTYGQALTLLILIEGHKYLN
jgi:unsaturated rhamnogalacturonyl hydrolase